MAKVRINITVDEYVKDASKELFDYMGIDLSTAINLFLWQAVEEWGFPFKPHTSQPNKKTIKAIKEFDKARKNPRRYDRYVASFNDKNEDNDVKNNKD